MTSSKWWQRYAPIRAPELQLNTLKRLIWIYLLLWLFEGVLRKWVFPAYSAPLVLIRDPVALFIILYAVAQGLWRPNLWILWLSTIGALSFLATLIIGINIPVAIIGLRTLCLHFPLIFIFAQVLTRADVEQIGNFIVDLSLPMGALVALQFASSSDSWLNAGAGLDAAQIGGVDGRIRPAGVFSYNTGLAQYYCLVTAFVLSRVVSQEKRSFGSLSAAAVGVVLAMSLSISRGLVLSIGLIGLVFIAGCLRTGISMRKLFPAFFIAAIIGIIFLFSGTVRQGIDAFALRWTLAQDSEGSIFLRALKGLFVDIDLLRAAGALGNGLGVGTNMGAKLLTGNVDFLLAEGEWDRLVLEMGAPLGLCFILWRICLTVSTGQKCVRALSRRDILPLALFAAAALNLLNGQTGVPMTLGFVVISVGITRASAKSHRIFAIRHGLLKQQRLPARLRPRRAPPRAT